MRDYDAEKRLQEVIHYHMEKCQYRREIDGVGVCSLNILPCEKVLWKGGCEAIAEWYQNKGGEDE